MKKQHLFVALGIVALIVVLVLVNKFSPPPVSVDPIVAAERVLTTHGLPVPNHAIMVTGTRPRNGSENAEGFVYTGDETIYIPSYSDTYQAAVRGESDAALKLASVLIHENVHANGTVDEAKAYDAQIDALIRMDAPYYMVNGVRLSKQWVLDHQKH